MNDPAANHSAVTPLNDGARERFLNDGYLVIRRAVDPERDLAPAISAFARLVDDLTRHVLGTAFPTAVPGYADMDLARRFATLVGLTHGTVFDHLDPALNVYERGYRHWRNAPAAQFPELFTLMRHPRILDAVERLIGPEIMATPAYHLNFKLAAAHLECLEAAAGLGFRSGSGARAALRPSAFIEAFQMGQTPWHMDEYPGLGCAGAFRYIGVWVPFTGAGPGRAPLLVLPRSHLDGYCDFPAGRIAEAVALDVGPGDIVLLDGKLFHASGPNTTRDALRWAFNLRYLPTGHRCGRPFLPSFVARSRSHPDSELRDPQLWQSYWRAALDYIDRYQFPMRHVFGLDVRQIERLDRAWARLLNGPDQWLALDRRGSPWKAARTRILRGVDRARARLSALSRPG